MKSKSYFLVFTWIPSFVNLEKKSLPEVSCMIKSKRIFHKKLIECSRTSEKASQEPLNTNYTPKYYSWFGQLLRLYVFCTQTCWQPFSFEIMSHFFSNLDLILVFQENIFFFFFSRGWKIVKSVLSKFISLSVVIFFQNGLFFFLSALVRSIRTSVKKWL